MSGPPCKPHRAFAERSLRHRERAEPSRHAPRLSQPERPRHHRRKAVTPRCAASTECWEQSSQLFGALLSLGDLLRGHLFLQRITVLGSRFICLGGQITPRIRFRVVLLHASASGVAGTQRELSRGVALLGLGFVSRNCLRSTSSCCA